MSLEKWSHIVECIGHLKSAMLERLDSRALVGHSGADLFVVVEGEACVHEDPKFPQ